MEQEVPENGGMMDTEDFDFGSIDKLQNCGVGAVEIQKLKAAGYHTVQSIVHVHPKKLLALKGFSDTKVEKLTTAAKSLVLGESPFMTASEYLEHDRLQVFHITTGSRELDKVLGGGLESKMLTEIHGEWRTGKTQLCHTLIPRDGYTGGKVIYIDTEGTFRPERLEPICTRFNVDYARALDNIFTVRAHNSEFLLSLMTDIGGLLAQERGVIKLVIIDSVMATYRADFSGRGELAERQQQLNQLLSLLHRHSEEWNLSVLLTNQMTSDPGATMSFVSDPKKPVGGHILAHGVQARVSVKKGAGEARIAKIVDSPNLPEAEAAFLLTPGGVADQE